MKIVARQQTLVKHVQDAEAFTDKNIGSEGLAHRRCILIQADEDSGAVTFSAESDQSAIRFSVNEGIDIIEGGEILVRANELSTVLSVVRPEDSTTLESDETGKNKGQRLSITGKHTEVEIGLIPISPKVTLPSVGSKREDAPWVELEPDQFAEGWRTGGAGYDSLGRYPVLTGVLVEALEDSVMFTSSNRKVTVYKQVPLIKREGELAMLLTQGVTSAALAYAGRGKRVRLTQGDAGQGGDYVHHVEVLGEDGDVLYHIRIAGLASSVAEFPKDRLLTVVEQLMSGASELVLDKAEMLYLMHSASRICELNAEETGGQAKTVHLNVSKKNLEVSVRGKSPYRDQTDLKSWAGAQDAEFAFQWGLYGSIIESSPGKDDAHFLILEKSDKPIALLAHTGEYDGKGLPNDYLAIIPVRDGVWVESKSKKGTRKS